MRRSGWRYWLVSVSVSLLLAGAACWIAISLLHFREEAPPPLYRRTIFETTEPTGRIPPMETRATTKEPIQKSAERVAVPAGRPLMLYFPKLKTSVRLDDKSCPQNEDGLFDPDRTNLMAACYVHNPSYVYEFPGTNAKDVAVFYGHTWREGEAAFNLLYDWERQRFNFQRGDEVWVRTVTSGKQWLVYRAENFFTPFKHGRTSLVNDETIWGAAPMPGKLITVGCLQPLSSNRNVVIRWQFAGVHS